MWSQRSPFYSGSAQRRYPSTYTTSLLASPVSEPLSPPHTRGSNGNQRRHRSHAAGEARRASGSNRRSPATSGRSSARSSSVSSRGSSHAARERGAAWERRDLVCHSASTVVDSDGCLRRSWRASMRERSHFRTWVRSSLPHLERRYDERAREEPIVLPPPIDTFYHALSSDTSRSRKSRKKTKTGEESEPTAATEKSAFYNGTCTRAQPPMSATASSHLPEPSRRVGQPRQRASERSCGRNTRPGDSSSNRPDERCADETTCTGRRPFSGFLNAIRHRFRRRERSSHTRASSSSSSTSVSSVLSLFSSAIPPFSLSVTPEELPALESLDMAEQCTAAKDTRGEFSRRAEGETTPPHAQPREPHQKEEQHASVSVLHAAVSAQGVARPMSASTFPQPPPARPQPITTLIGEALFNEGEINLVAYDVHGAYRASVHEAEMQRYKRQMRHPEAPVVVQLRPRDRFAFGTVGITQGQFLRGVLEWRISQLQRRQSWSRACDGLLVCDQAALLTSQPSTSPLLSSFSVTASSLPSTSAPHAYPSASTLAAKKMTGVTAMAVMASMPTRTLVPSTAASLLPPPRPSARSLPRASYQAKPAPQPSQLPQWSMALSTSRASETMGTDGAAPSVADPTLMAAKDGSHNRDHHSREKEEGHAPPLAFDSAKRLSDDQTPQEWRVASSSVLHTVRSAPAMGTRTAASSHDDTATSGVVGMNGETEHGLSGNATSVSAPTSSTTAPPVTRRSSRLGRGLHRMWSLRPGKNGRARSDKEREEDGASETVGSPALPRGRPAHNDQRTDEANLSRTCSPVSPALAEPVERENKWERVEPLADSRRGSAHTLVAHHLRLHPRRLRLRSRLYDHQPPRVCRPLASALHTSNGGFTDASSSTSTSSLPPPILTAGVRPAAAYSADSVPISTSSARVLLSHASLSGPAPLTHRQRLRERLRMKRRPHVPVALNADPPLSMPHPQGKRRSSRTGKPVAHPTRTGTIVLAPDTLARVRAGRLQAKCVRHGTEKCHHRDRKGTKRSRLARTLKRRFRHATGHTANPVDLMSTVASSPLSSSQHDHLGQSVSAIAASVGGAPIPAPISYEELVENRKMLSKERRALMRYLEAPLSYRRMSSEERYGTPVPYLPSDQQL